MEKRINIRCKKCNQKIMEYEIQNIGDTIVLAHGISISCHRCKRVLRFMKYTENMLIERSADGNLKI